PCPRTSELNPQAAQLFDAGLDGFLESRDLALKADEPTDLVVQAALLPDRLMFQADRALPRGGHVAVASAELHCDHSPSSRRARLRWIERPPSRSSAMLCVA